MLVDVESLLAIEATVEQALAETARSYGYDVDQVRSAASGKFGDLEQHAWKLANRR